MELGKMIWSLFHSPQRPRCELAVIGRKPPRNPKEAQDYLRESIDRFETAIKKLEATPREDK